MRLKIVAVWVICQLLFFAAWTLREESYLADGAGQSILVKVAPVDPRDLLRGQYMRLAYHFSRPEGPLASAASLPNGSSIWVVLQPEGEFHVPKTFYSRPPQDPAPGEAVLRGRVARRQFRFGIESYFVPEGTETPDRKDLSVRLRVDSRGKVRIEQVYLKGVPWP